MPRNKIDTPGYFLKRLRDSGYITIKIYSDFAPEDDRKWMVAVSPSKDTVFITCYRGNENGRTLFEINDGGNKWPRNYFLKTSSINVIIEELKTKEITLSDSDSKFYKEK